MAEGTWKAKVFAVAGVGPVCSECLQIVKVETATLREERVQVTCPTCGWSGTVEKTFADVQDLITIPPTMPKGKV